MTEKKQEAFTHGGKFHADDVFSSALLKMVFPDIEILRGFQVPEQFDGPVFDIGFGKYDHHQQDAEKRENGIPYAAFGLLWREFGTKLLTEEEAKEFDQNFVQPLDLDDNTGCGHLLADAVEWFNPNWDEEKDANSCFEEAVSFAFGLLERKFASIQSARAARELVLDALEKAENNIVILKKYMPWKKTLAGTKAEFIVYPSQRGGFCAQSIPIREGGKETKYQFPQEWAGKTPEELAEQSGIATLTFCHNGRFLITALSLEDILKACEKTKNG